MNAWEREEEQLERDLREGNISQRDYNIAMREIQRDYREAARESAHEAYEHELGNW